MTFRLGLTGSIGMGKSTTSGFFAEAGIPVWDADAAVHACYLPGGAAVRPVAALLPDVPDVITVDGALSRPHLRARIVADPTLLDRINAIVHPLVAADRRRFLTEHATTRIVVLDIPLLFENGLDAECDGVVVVSAPADMQRQRLRDRNQMTDDEITLILSRQMPDAEKRARATWVIETTSFDNARAGVAHVLSAIEQRLGHA